MYRRSRFTPLPFIIFAVFILFVGILLFFFLSPSQQAKRVVDQFYSYEQDGQYSSSWQLFHPAMKQRFSRSNYIQDRAHVFMNHFGVDTFSYSLSRPQRKRNWTKTMDGEPFDRVYEVTVTQVYKGKYGKFTIIQDVYVAKALPRIVVEDEVGAEVGAEGEDGERVGNESDSGWMIMWDYNHQ